MPSRLNLQRSLHNIESTHKDIGLQLYDSLLSFHLKLGLLSWRLKAIPDIDYKDRRRAISCLENTYSLMHSKAKIQHQSINQLNLSPTLKVV
jgi:hypothetical protein